MANADRCHRCKMPIVGDAYFLRVAADPADARALEMTLCETCLASFRRWVIRQNRSPERVDMPESGEQPPSGRRGRKSGESPYAAALDHGVAQLQTRLYASAIVIALAVCMMLGLGFYMFIADSN